MAMQAALTGLGFTLAQAAATGSGGDKSYALWAVILLGVAVVLFLLEVMLPTGGVIGLMAAVSLVAGIVMLFKIDTTVGLIGAVVALAAVPFLFAFVIKVWPYTPIGQRLTLRTPGALDGSKGGPADTAGATQNLIGTQGQALTDLRPVGTCLINGQRHQCLAETGLIPAGTTVRVVDADGMGIKVRAEPQSAPNASA